MTIKTASCKFNAQGVVELLRKKVNHRSKLFMVYGSKAGIVSSPIAGFQGGNRPSNLTEILV